MLAVAAAAGAGAGAAVDGAAAAGTLLVVVAAFFGAFLAGDAERLRLLLVALGLLDERAAAVFFLSPAAGFLLGPGVFDRLRGLAALGFFAVATAAFLVFLPVEVDFFFAGAEANLKLPLAPIPLVCFND